MMIACQLGNYYIVLRLLDEPTLDVNAVDNVSISLHQFEASDTASCEKLRQPYFDLCLRVNMSTFVFQLFSLMTVLPHFPLSHIVF